MQNYLQQILTESNTIIIPGLGALTITSTKTGDIYFMPFLKHDDGTLSKYIAKVEGIELVDAKNMISNFVANIQSSFENGGNYEMEEFGRFLLTKDGEIDFQRWEDYQIKNTATSILSKKINERKLNTKKTEVPKSTTTAIETPIVKEEPAKIEEPIKTDVEIHEQREEELPISANPIEEPATHQAITAQKSIDELLNDTEHAADSMQSELFQEPIIISNELIRPIEEEVSDFVDTTTQEQEEIKTVDELIETPDRKILAQTDPSIDNIPTTIIETNEDKKALRKKQKNEHAAAKAEQKRLKKSAKLEAKAVAKEAEISAPKEKKKSRSMLFWLFFAILITAGTMWYIKVQRDSKVHLTVIDKKASKIVTTKVIEKNELHKEIAKHSTKENTSENIEKKVAEIPKKPVLEVEKQKTEAKKTIIPTNPIKEVEAKKEITNKEKNEAKSIISSTPTKLETVKNATTTIASTKTDIVAKGNIKSPSTNSTTVNASTPVKTTVSPKIEKTKPTPNPANAVVITSSTPIIKPVPAPPKPVVINANPGYTSQNKNIQVIVGTFKDKASADQFVSNLKADGFTTAFQKEKNGTFEVNLGKFTTLSETSKALQKYRGVKK
jgi:hypothetical protein